MLHVPDGELDTSRSRLMLADLVDFERSWRAVWWQCVEKPAKLKAVDFAPDILPICQVKPDVLPPFNVCKGRLQDAAAKRIRGLRPSRPRRPGSGPGPGPGAGPGGGGSRARKKGKQKDKDEEQDDDDVEAAEVDSLGGVGAGAALLDMMRKSRRGMHLPLSKPSCPKQKIWRQGLGLPEVVLASRAVDVPPCTEPSAS